MANTTIGNMVVYNAEFYSGLVESVAQEIGFVNANSRDTIRLVPNRHRGDYKKVAFWPFVDLVNERDDTSTAAQNAETMPEAEYIWVKAKRKAKLVRITEDALKSTGRSIEEAVRVYGQQVGQQKVQDMLNLGVAACNAALSNISALENDISAGSPGTATTQALNGTLAKFGDRASAVRAWAMHSKPNFDIVGGLLADKVTGLTDTLTIQGAIPALMGRAALVSDVPGLLDDSGSSDIYATLGLVPEAITVEESDIETFAVERRTGLANIVYEMQAEWAVTIGIKGFKWDGSRNPDAADLATAGNWVKVATANKDLAGVRLISK